MKLKKKKLCKQNQSVKKSLVEMREESGQLIKEVQDDQPVNTMLCKKVNELGKKVKLE